MRPVSRVTPALPVGAMKTYSATMPLASHWRDGSCAEVDCQAHLNGWLTAVDESSDLGQRQAHYIRRHAGRRYREQHAPDGRTEFTFEAGQQCFARHKVPLERPALFLVRPGDWRGTTGPTRRHQRGADWVEDMAGTLDRVRQRQERG